MNLAIIKSAVTSKVGRQILITQKNSPKILFVAGVVGMAGATVLACKATLKLDEILDDAEKEHVQLGELTQSYSEKRLKRAHLQVNATAATKIVRLYAPAVGVGIVSIAALTKSQSILNERNAAVMAAYSALDKGFKEYRRRVVEEFGDDKDYELRHGSESITEIVEGKKGPVEMKHKVMANPGDHSIYARFFDELNPNWESNPSYNRIFLHHQQSWANDLLHSRGHVFLNDVYDALGMERSSEAQVVGWLLTKNGSGDNFIDFGIFDGDDWRKRAFVNGIESGILLDFNVDGVIWDKI